MLQISGDRNVVQMEAEKILKDLTIETQHMGNVKTSVMPVAQNHSENT
jgi:hypothetical protein